MTPSVPLVALRTKGAAPYQPAAARAGRNMRSFKRGMPHGRSAGRGMWAPTKSSVAKGIASGPPSRTWCVVRSGVWRVTESAPIGIVCTDMHRPYLTAVAQILPDAEVQSPTSGLPFRQSDQWLNVISQNSYLLDCSSNKCI
jgi:hypothetical protein